ncbi:hypothetical protein CI109_105587 [Kwoniella shandongensis]|uniref:Uncharacterized protein n=1 Tax=Kwoniella shandongensis TaxID=1734106 RepID=A0A5M6C3Q0_9TREE|nr:uncharacterized protein CI109_002304 [Kwoniella shandongensis]KAA5529411.1 hypothetical protein CI109_002304 [Kwoniella shandongensis]
MASSSSQHPTIPRLDIPSVSETAVFQHTPDHDAQLKREWEPGCQPDEVYDRYLPPWRAWLRRALVRRLRREKDWMADWQKKVRTETRDKYFYWTAIFGTHTFFMAFLPVLFLFDAPLKGRGMLYVVGMGIYISSFSKDLVCVPRPYSPPVIRLSMSTHHHEYGFPSSHSTNSVSIALFLGQWIYEARDRIGWSAVLAAWFALFFYAISVVGGRFYTGMHSSADIIGGSLMGVACWILWIVVGNASEAWVNTGTWLVPALAIPITLALVHYHPEPVDDCPCFADAIAVLAVVMGSFVGHWWSVVGLKPASLTRGHALHDNGLAVGITVAVLRLVVGLGALFAWRLVAKATLLRILPPIFRAASKIFDIPTRRFYKAATDYNKVPPSVGFRAIPSVLDLQTGRDPASPAPSPINSPSLSPNPSMRSVSPINVRNESHNHALRSRSGKGILADEQKSHVNSDARSIKGAVRRKQVPKYDAEVLTKVGVYSGIGIIATTLMPTFFEWAEDRLLG